MRLIYKLSTLLIRLFMFVFGNYKVIHKERLSDWTNCIIAANHISYFDPPFIGSVLPVEISYLAKSELFANPMFGSLLRYYNALPVKRGVVDRSVLDRIKTLLAGKKSILIFPEGSRKSYTAKPGIGILAYEMKVPILPLYIENSNHLLRCLIRKKRLVIRVGEKINPAEFANLPADKNTYRNIAEKTLEKINRLPYED